MPARAFFRLSELDHFPDLTIPEKTDKPAGPLRPLARSPSWRAGDRVLAPWEPHFLYFGVISHVQDNQAHISFGDGDSGWILLDQIRPLVVQAGQRVLSRRKMSSLHFPAEIIELRGEQVCVHFDDNQQDAWTTLAALRIPCEPIGPAAIPTKVASHLALAENLRPGDRVWAPWQNGVLFAGSVDKVQGKEAHIHFDDGDAGWVQHEQVLPLEIPIGLPVMGRWKMGGQYYPGTVAEVQGERIRIHYDDGDKEWTKPAALALPMERFGPDARPTRTAVARAPSQVLTWLVPIGIAVLIALIRAGCR
jgi:hypothetical protein